MTESFANEAETTLNGSINDSTTSITVTSAADFPSSGNYRIRIEDEFMLVTAGQGTTSWTVTREAEDSARFPKAAHGSGATVTQILTAGGLGQGLSEAGAPHPFVPITGGGAYKFDTGQSLLYDRLELARFILVRYIELFASEDESIWLEPNETNPGGPAKLYILGGSGVVFPLLSADPSGGDSEDGQVYYNTTSNKLKVYANGSWVDLH